MQQARLQVNGKDVSVEVDDPDMPLLYVLRDHLGLHGPRFGCGLGQCGACTVHIGGTAVRSCIVPLSSVNGDIVTLEGLGTAEKPHPLQRAFIEEQAVQCGYCINGMIMQAAALLARTPKPTDYQIRLELAANLCRCGTHLLRRAAATARHALLTRAAAKLRVEAAALSLCDGMVVASGGRKLPLGTLVGNKGLSLKLDMTAPLKSPDDYSLVGKPVQRLDIPDKVTGRFTFMQDFKVPDMLHGRVIRPAALGATLLDYDTSSIQDIPGLVKVVRIENFLGVVARTE